jgi:hypothetical protein
VDQMTEASTVQPRLPFPWSVLGGRKRNASCLHLLYQRLTQREPTTSEPSSFIFDQLTHWQEQVHVELQSPMLYLALKTSTHT